MKIWECTRMLVGDSQLGDEDDEETDDITGVVVQTHTFTKMERLKIVDYVINQVVDVSQLQIFFETANKTFEGVFDGFDILKFLLEDDESIYFPLHERHKLIKMDPKKDMFERIKSEKSVYDRLEAERQKARFLKQTAMVKAEPKKKPEVQIHRLQAQKSPFGPGKPLESRPNASVSVSRYGQQGGFISSVKLSSAFGSRQQNIMDRSARTPVETSQIQVERLTEDPELSDDDLDLSWKLRESQIKKIRIAIKSLRVLKGYDDADLGHIKKMLLLQARKEAIQKSNKPFELKDARLLSQVERAPFSPNFDIRLEQFKNIYQDAFRLYDIDDELLIEAVWGAIEYSQPLRHKILPLMCKKGDPEELHRFQTQQENALKYPLDGHLGTSIWTGNSAMFPESTMRDYFGEKITLYFSFLAFYRDELVYPVIVGILQNIIIIVYFAADVPPVGLVRFSADWYIKKVFQWSSFAFAGYIVVWSKRVVFLWEGYEDNFCAKYSIKKQEEGQEENYTVRTKFKGKLGRNISTDLMNERMEIKPWTFFIQIVILIFVLGSVALALFVSWAILPKYTKS